MNKKHTSTLKQITSHLDALKQLVEQSAEGQLPLDKIEAEALKLYEECVIQRYLNAHPIEEPETSDERPIDNDDTTSSIDVEEITQEKVESEDLPPTEEEPQDPSIEPPQDSVEEDPTDKEQNQEPTEGNEPEHREVFESFQTADEMDEGISYSPIDDLKKAIGLNDRFMFANELFSGHGEEYAKAIEEFNHLESMEDAERLIEAKFAEKYRWNKEDEAVKLFKTFLYRRYLSKG